jgi:hypothetical protein
MITCFIDVSSGAGDAQEFGRSDAFVGIGAEPWPEHCGQHTFVPYNRQRDNNQLL